MCDNEIDRDYERFSISALNTLAELFVGKTGIFDHDPKAANQNARIFRAHVERDSSRLTSAGEPYCMLKADAYMLRGPKQEDLIAEIEAGIKKEVSIGCSVRSAVCSICGKDLQKGKCSHQKGRSYQANGKEQTCHAVLDEPTDAYEWSFVAVPAQRNAGVYKHYNPNASKKEGTTMQEILKRLRQPTGSITLTAEEANTLSNHIGSLELLAQAGEEYHKNLQRDILSLSSQSGNELDGKVLSGILKKLDLTELRELKSSYERQVQKAAGYVSQLTGNAKQDGKDNHFFKI